MERDIRDQDTMRLLWSLRRSRVAVPELTRRAVAGSVVNTIKAGIYLNQKVEQGVKR